MLRISAYDGVLAAFREPRLMPEGPETTHLRMKTTSVLSYENLTRWQVEMRQAAELFPRASAVEVYSELIEPYCAAAARIVTSTCPDEAIHMALSRTLGAILANGWLALVEPPDQLSLLHREPALAPRAVEEMLRLAAVPAEIFRVAAEAFQFSGIALAEGERVSLDIGAANLDSRIFHEPDRFDLHRRGIANRTLAHLAFGHGAHSCVGAALIRMAATVATEAFAEKFAEARLDSAVQRTDRSQYSYASAFRIRRD